MEKEFELKGRKVVGGKAEGEALVTSVPMCFFPLMDRDTGVITDSGHPLYGKSVSGKVLVYPTGKGSTGTTYAIYDMCSMRGTGPKALVMIQAEPISTIGAIMGEIPVVDSFDASIFENISNGDLITVDGDAGIIRVTRKGDAAGSDAN